MVGFLGNPLPGGLYVVDIYKDSPLARAGVQSGDMIYTINNHQLDLYGDIVWHEDKISLTDYASRLKIGQEMHIVLYRKGVRKDIAFIFEQSERLPIHRVYPGYEPLDYEIIMGMLIQPLAINHLPLLVNAAPSLTRYAEMKHQLEPVLVVTHIFPNSQAMKSRTLSIGTILDKVNGVPVRTLDEVRAALFKGFDSNFLTIETRDSLFVVVPFRKTMLEEKRMAADYFYTLSSVMQKIIQKIEEEEKERIAKAISLNFLTTETR